MQAKSKLEESKYSAPQDGTSRKYEESICKFKLQVFNLPSKVRNQPFDITNMPEINSKTNNTSVNV